MKFADLSFYAAGWIGHAALWLVALNVLYSRRIHRTVLKVARVVDGVVVFSVPLVLTALLFGKVIDPGLGRHQAPLALEIYLAACDAICVLVIPAVTAARHLRPSAPHLVSRRGEIVDFAHSLGRKPAGDSKYRRLALLPFNQVFQVEFTELTLRLPELPAAWDGLTILHLSDLHFIGTPERVFYELALERCMVGGTPDLLAITGDLIDTDTHHRWLLPLLGRLRWKEAALAILGNHDIWHDPPRLRRRLQRLGMVVLANAWREITIRGEPLIAIGHEGPWFQPGPDLKGCPATGFRLCLSHTPDNLDWARENRVPLMLSGHNHGGQIRLPLFGSLFVPSWYSRRYDGGLFWEAPTLLHVSRGLAGKEPLRYNCRPEITRMILKKD